ncbi:uncharacterized protein LOC120351484 [Nilaparvata lugens]|uniref:uncharacterized protein LOC120351484 n=1 Tax=Nilaparvata lugens TaxID=108931 RepID=UPI00193DF3A5|nr:uncharacterized protein LOC120351484 [Nilaparvata lugens]
MMADVSQLEAVNNDGIDTMQLDSDMKREMLAQLKDDQVAVKGARVIDAVGSQLITLQTKHHQLASNYDQQMMKTNQLMGAINESNKRKRQLYIDLVTQNSSLDEKEKCLIGSFTNFSSFMEEKMASFGEMIDAERHSKEKIEEVQRLCQEYETQIDDGRSLCMEDIVCYRRGIAEKLKLFTSSQADTISSSSQMISSIVSDGNSDLCELTAANEETKLLVNSVANKLHEFEEKLTAIQMLAQKSAEELVNMMKEHNSTLKEMSKQEIKDGFDSFSSSLTNFLKNKLLVTPASGDTPKREDILKITEEAGIEIDYVDTVPSTIGLRPQSQIQTFKEKENVKESKIGKANTGIPRTTRILEEINN